MDIHKALRGLHDEKKRIERAITRLEQRMTELMAQPKPRRGRKGMSPEERLEVSRRISAYWEKRRNQQAQSGEQLKSED